MSDVRSIPEVLIKEYGKFNTEITFKGHYNGHEVYSIYPMASEQHFGRFSGMMQYALVKPESKSYRLVTDFDHSVSRALSTQNA